MNTAGWRGQKLGRGGGRKNEIKILVLIKYIIDKI